MAKHMLPEYYATLLQIITPIIKDEFLPGARLYIEPINSFDAQI